MTLPRIDLPQYTIKLKSDDSKIVFRPFMTGEEKVLLMAMENKDEKEIILSIKQVISNCVVEPKNFDVSKLASFDLDWLFLNLRARSIGENVTQNYTCRNIPEGTEKECGAMVLFEFSVLDVDFEIPPDHSKKIMISDNVGIMMRYPTLAMAEEMNMSKDATPGEISWEFLVKCVEYIFDKDNIYYASETPKEELNEFLERIPLDKFDKIDTFFQTMPHIEKSLDKTCEKCGFGHHIVLDDLLSFFA